MNIFAPSVNGVEYGILASEALFLIESQLPVDKQVIIFRSPAPFLGLTSYLTEIQIHIIVDL